MTVYGAGRHHARRRRVLLGAAFGLLLAATAFARADHPAGGRTHPRDEKGRTPLSPVSWPAAGGCLASFTDITVAGRPLTAIGVVLGQRHGSDTSALLAAAGAAATQLIQSVLPAAGGNAIAAPGPTGDRRPDASGLRLRLPTAPGAASAQP